MTDSVARQYRYRAYPTPEQAALLDFYAAGVRAFWNKNVTWLHSLEDREGQDNFGEGKQATEAFALMTAYAPGSLEAARDKKHPEHERWKAFTQEATGPRAPGWYAWVRHYGDAKLKGQLNGNFSAAVRVERERGLTFWHAGAEHLITAVPAKALHGACGSKGQLKAAVDAVLKKRAKGERADLPARRSWHKPQNLRWQVQDGTQNATRESLVIVTGKRNAFIPLLSVPGYRGGKRLRVRYHRELPADASISFMQVTWNPRTSRFFVTLTLTTVQAEVPAASGLVGLDRGVAAAVATSDGERYDTPGLSSWQRRRENLLHQSLSWKRRVKPCKGKCAHEPGGCWRTSRRYALQATARQRLLDIQEDRTDDGAHKASRSIARRYAIIGIEELANLKTARSAKGTKERPGKNVKASAGRNRENRAANWGRIERYLEYKAARVVKVPAAYTSQACPDCGYVSSENRATQAEFRCMACGLSGNADVIAAQNIAEATAKTARALRDNGQGSSSRTRERPGANREPANTHNSTAEPGDAPVVRQAERSGTTSDPGEHSQAAQPRRIRTEFEGSVIPEDWGIPGARERKLNRRSKRGKIANGRNAAGA